MLGYGRRSATEHMIDWDEIFLGHWSTYDPHELGDRIRNPGTTESEIRRVELEIGFGFPEEFHDCYRAANGFGIDRLELVPIERIPEFIKATRSRISGSHKSIADRFFPFIDNKYGPTGYFLKMDGSISPQMRRMDLKDYYDNPRLDSEEFMKYTAESIWSFLTC